MRTGAKESIIELRWVPENMLGSLLAAVRYSL
jgi:hypothetical protein